jgi:hypothetical protein
MTRCESDGNMHGTMAMTNCEKSTRPHGMNADHNTCDNDQSGSQWSPVASLLIVASSSLPSIRSNTTSKELGAQRPA